MPEPRERLESSSIRASLPAPSFGPPGKGPRFLFRLHRITKRRDALPVDDRHTDMDFAHKFCFGCSMTYLLAAGQCAARLSSPALSESESP